jgi:hypothetical protein
MGHNPNVQVPEFIVPGDRFAAGFTILQRLKALAGAAKARAPPRITSGGR